MRRRETTRALAAVLLVGLLALSSEPVVAAPDAAVGSGASALDDVARLPGGGTRVFRNAILVAFYGTAGTGALGVLGEDTPDRITQRLRAAAASYATEDRAAQIVYELIVSIADRSPGPDGDYSHDIDRAKVRRYIRAAHRNAALLVLDLQPGRSGFLTVAKRWAWALSDPWVGLALDPEWRMARGEVPGETIGHVDSAEVNRVTRWLNRLTRRQRLPQKVFVLHQFRTDMVTDIEAVLDRPHLAEVQHVDGFGSRAQKLATYHHVARPDQFRMGFKLFYDEDRDLMPPERVLGIHPRVRFVSYQ